MLVIDLFAAALSGVYAYSSVKGNWLALGLNDTRHIQILKWLVVVEMSVAGGTNILNGFCASARAKIPLGKRISSDPDLIGSHHDNHRIQSAREGQPSLLARRCR